MKKETKLTLKKLSVGAISAVLAFAAQATDANGNDVTGYRATAIGYDNQVAGNYAVTIGHKNNASGSESSVVGERSSATGANSSAFGSNSHATADSALAMGSGAAATADTAVAIGNDSTAGGKSSVSLGGSSVATGSFGTALGDTASALADGSVAISVDSKAQGTNSMALGRGAVTTHDNSVALGSQSVSKLEKQVTTATVGENAYSGFAGTNPIATVSVGDKGKERQIVNVAAGEISQVSTDAINGSQLYAVTNQVSSNKAAITGNSLGVAVNRADIDAQAAQIAVNHQAIAQRAQSATDQQAAINRNNTAIAQVRADVAGLNSRVTLVDKKLRAGIAGAGAIAALPQVRKDGHHALAVGASHYRGESAVAVKYSQAAESGKWTYSLSGAIDTSGNGLIAGGIAREW